MSEQHRENVISKVAKCVMSVDKRTRQHSESLKKAGEEMRLIATCLSEANERLKQVEASSKIKYATPCDLNGVEARMTALAREAGKAAQDMSEKSRAELLESVQSLSREINGLLASQNERVDAKLLEVGKGFSPRGEWTNGMTLDRMDIVTLVGSSYLVLKNGVTKKPSVKDKENFQVLAKRGAGGGGSLPPLGTAATRDVGQASGNVLELSAAGTVTLGGGGTSGSVLLWDLTLEQNIAVAVSDGEVFFIRPGVAPVGIPLNYSETNFVAFRPIEKSANFTAELEGSYTITASATAADPTPAQGKGYVATVRNGTYTTPRGSYSVAGTIVQSIYHSGAWQDYPHAPFAGTLAIGSVTGLGTGVSTALAIDAGTTGGFVRTSDTATTSAPGVVPGIGVDAINNPTGTNAATLAQINGVARRSQSMLFSDFMGRISGVYQTDGFQWGAQSGSGGSIADQATEAGHPGIVRLSTGASSAAGFYGLDSVSTNNAVYLLNDGTLFWEWCIRIPTLSDGTDRFIIHVGCALANASVAAAMFSIRYSDDVNSGKFQGVCRSASSETTVDTGITVAANTWYRVGALMNAAGTSAQFYVDGVARGAPITTNIPAATGRIGGGIFKTLGTAARTMDVDYTYYLKTFTTAR